MLYILGLSFKDYQGVGKRGKKRGNPTDEEETIANTAMGTEVGVESRYVVSYSLD